MGPPRLPITAPTTPQTARCLRAAGLGAAVSANGTCSADRATNCLPALTTEQAAAAAKRLHGVAGCQGVRQSILARPVGTSQAGGPAAPAPTRRALPVPPTTEKTEVRILSPLEVRIEAHRATAIRDFPAAATRLRPLLTARGTTISDEAHQAAVAHATAALRHATIVQFQRVSPVELERRRSQEKTTALLGGERTLLSEDGKTIYYAFDVPGNGAPGGLYDSGSGRIFVNVGVAAGSNGATVFAHEAAHAYLHRLGISSRNHAHHDLMAQVGLIVAPGNM
ncbi:MAG: hypothetical protein HY696_02495 [Deltaproteobacteria bacterium]|nr:hypothetical protein [Deltaproteobacteria bacterium]